MGKYRLLTTVLCVYEGLRLAFLVGAFVLLSPEGAVKFPWLALISPEALFLLMAVFWRLNMPLYRAYGPLYLAGKGLSIITTMFWLFFVKSSMLRELSFYGTAIIAVLGINVFLVLGDVISAWLVTIIMRGDQCE
jgi:drug/metabolite transporter superfamily protein YnfA